MTATATRTQTVRYSGASSAAKFYPARTNADGDLVPTSGPPGGRCPLCGGDEFEPVVLDPDRKRD
jgi:hypothetical protein